MHSSSGDSIKHKVDVRTNSSVNIKRLSSVGGVGSKDYVQEVENRVVSGKEAETIS